VIHLVKPDKSCYKTRWEKLTDERKDAPIQVHNEIVENALSDDAILKPRAELIKVLVDAFNQANFFSCLHQSGGFP
jgi:hypothetical protein